MKKLTLLLTCFFLVIILQAQVTKTVNVTAGELSSKLTATEKATVTNLTVTGTIDARDFKTMRDMMATLNVIDLSNVSIAAYTGLDGTWYKGYNYSYPKNEIPPHALENRSNLNQIIMPSTITSIGSSTFSGCSKLTSVIIPSSVTIIGESAFVNCKGLNSIIIPSSVITIKDAAFKNCVGLTSMTISNGVKTISYDAFAECTSLISVTIPSSVISIETNAFRSCINLISVSVDLPSSLISIGSCAFQSCVNLNSILLPPSVTTIGEGAFDRCEDLTSIMLPSSLTSIERRVFYQCNKLETIIIPSSVKTIGYAAFYECKSMSSVSIPESVISIDGDAFFGCSGLKSVVLPISVTSIGESSFSACHSLTSLTLSTSITSIGNHSFSHCDSLTSVIIPSSVTSIGAGAFSNCSNLSSINIPPTVSSIGSGAFSDCTSLKSLEIPYAVTLIESGAFSGCSLLLTIDPKNLNYTVIDSLLYNIDLSTLKYCPENKTGIIKIPSTVINIEDYVFRGCDNLSSISIPSSVTSYGDEVFEYCYGLKSIYSYAQKPIDISESYDVFYDEDFFANCTLYVPKGSKNAYQTANQWKEFINIVEMSLTISSDSITIGPIKGDNASISVTSNLPKWTATSDQSWLTVSPDSTAGNGTLNFIANTNNSNTTRMATITIMAEGTSDQSIVVTQVAGNISGSDFLSEHDFMVYPNPVTDGFYVEGIEGAAILVLSDLNGRIRLTKKVSGNEFLSISSLPQGIYIVSIKDDNGLLKTKLVKN